jgi:hypothetical protein
MFKGENLNLSLRGTFFVTKQSPYSSAGDCELKKQALAKHVLSAVEGSASQ